MNQIVANPFEIWDLSTKKLVGKVTTPQTVVPGQGTQALELTATSTENSAPNADTSQGNSTSSDNVTPLPSEQAGATQNHDYEKRYKDLQSGTTKVINDLKNQLNLMKQEQSKKAAPALPKTPQELAKFKKDFPDVFDTMVSIAREEAIATDARLRESLESISATTNELNNKSEMTKLLEIHPDAEDIRASTEFANWFNEQPLEIQNIIDKSRDHRAIAKQLTLYKTETGIVKKAKKAVKDATKIVETNSPVVPEGEQKPIIKASDVKKLSPQMFAKYEAVIEEARREGRFIQDIR